MSPLSLTDSVTAAEREWQVVGQSGAQRLGQVGDLGRIGELLVQPRPQLVEPVPRFAVECRGELGSVDP